MLIQKFTKKKKHFDLHLKKGSVYKRGGGDKK